MCYILIGKCYLGFLKVKGMRRRERLFMFFNYSVFPGSSPPLGLYHLAWCRGERPVVLYKSLSLNSTFLQALAVNVLYLGSK